MCALALRLGLWLVLASAASTAAIHSESGVVQPPPLDQTHAGGAWLVRPPLGKFHGDTHHEQHDSSRSFWRSRCAGDAAPQKAPAWWAQSPHRRRSSSKPGPLAQPMGVPRPRGRDAFLAFPQRINREGSEIRVCQGASHDSHCGIGTHRAREPSAIAGVTGCFCESSAQSRPR